MGYEEARKVVMDMKKLGSGFMPQNMRKFEAIQTAIDAVSLTFLEPKDITLESQQILTIKGAEIRMKEGSYPAHRADGTEVVNNTELGKYENTALVIDGLELGKTYYFAAFPYSDNGIYNESGSEANRAEITVKEGESVTVNVGADSTREFKNITVTCHNVTKETEETQTLDGEGRVSFNVAIGNEYYLTAGEVENYEKPEETEHYTAIPGGSRVVDFTYSYLMEVITATMSADDKSDITAQKFICHNVTTGEDEVKAYSAAGVQFTIPDGQRYYVTATEKDFYATPQTDTYTAARGNTREAALEYRYNMEKITVILTAENNADVTGQKVICHNVTTGEDTEKQYNAGSVSFMVPNGNEYYITASEMDFYETPKSETYTAEKGNSRAAALEYKYIMEVITVTLSADDESDVSDQTLICHNVTTGTDTKKEYSADGVSFMVPDGEQYYITATAKELYATPKTDTYTAVKGNKRTESLQYVYAPDLESCTPALIKQIAESGQAASIWEIGDKKKITTTTGEEIEIAIADFDHDELADGSGKAPITFTMTHSFATAQNMNSSNTNVGGWTSCAMRSRMDTILKTLPQEWQDIIVSVKKKTSAGNQQSTISTTEDKLFLFSEVEVFGTTSYSYTGEGSQYPYFATQANRVKTLGINGSADGWWERSPISGNTTSFCRVYSGGNADYLSASNTRGVSVGFCA